MLSLKDYLNSMEDGQDIILVANDAEGNETLGNHRKENWLLALEWMGNPRFTVVQRSERYGYVCLKLGEIKSRLTKRLDFLGNDAAFVNSFIEC